MRALTADEEARARRLHAEAFVFAAHTDFDHVDHFAALVGPAHVGLGPDCIEQWPAELYRQLWAATEMAGLEFRYPPEFDSLAKCANVTRGLVARGYDDVAIRGIMGDNMLRVFEAVLPAAS
jgi:membrane dipeptidase